MQICEYIIVFFFKQKTAYEIGTGDWSSDVCSSDLVAWHGEMAWDRDGEGNHEGTTVFALVPDEDNPRDRKSVV